MMRRRCMHALLGTLALVAGCSTTHRTEVSGTVRDRATGRGIPGARVLGADGTLARTDANGRFTLYVRPGRPADVRVSADGHAPEHVELAGAEASVELAATTFDGDSFVIQAAEAPVLSWTEESWIASDGGSPDGAIEPVSHERAHVGDVHDGALGAGATCVGCHADTLGVGRAGEGDAHAALADSCVACHAAPSGDDASVSCARCHGTGGAALRDGLREEIDTLSGRASRALDRAIAVSAASRGISTSCGGTAAHFTQVGGAFVLVGSDGAVLGDCDRDRVRDDEERWAAVEELGPDLAMAVSDLAWVQRDGSHGAHAPERVRAVLRSLAH